MRKTNPPSKCPSQCANEDTFECSKCVEYSHFKPKKARKNPIGRAYVPYMKFECNICATQIRYCNVCGKDFKKNQKIYCKPHFTPLKKYGNQTTSHYHIECAKKEGLISKDDERFHWRTTEFTQAERKNPSDKDVVMANSLWSFKDEPAESYFSHSSCDFCDSSLGGNRYDIKFKYDTKGKAYEASICEDCVQDIAGTRDNPPGHYQCQYCFKYHPSMVLAVNCHRKEKDAQMRTNPQSHLKGRCSHCDRLVMKCDNGKCEERFVAFNNIWCNGKEHYCLRCATLKGLM